MHFFSVDGKIYSVLRTVGDLVILNVLTMFCSIPIVTMGPAISAMYHVTLLMVKGEEGNIMESYFRELKDSILHTLPIWLLFLGVELFLLFDLFILRTNAQSWANPYRGILIALIILVSMICQSTLATAARFTNTRRNIIKNGMIFCFINIVGSFIMLVIALIPWCFIFISYRLLSLLFLFGMSVPAFAASFYYRKLFDKYMKAEIEEEKEEGKEEEELLLR